ncbi:putative bifunctional diguanylate cyclase/phosphodiesterase [Sulfurimonas sp.]
MSKTRKNKIFYIGVILIAIYLSVTYIYTTQSVDSFTKQKYLDVSKDMKEELQTLIQEKSEATLLVTIGLAANNSMVSVFKSGNAHYLDLNDFALTLKRYSSLENVWFQLIDKNGISIYRSWTQNKGDNLASIRSDVASMITTPRVISSVSIGKYDLTFKTMVPVYDHIGRFLGMVETLAKFDSIASKMAMKDYQTLIVVDKRYKSQLSKAYTNTFINNYYVVNPLSGNKLLKALRNQDISNYLHIDTYKIDRKNKLLVTTYILKDINGVEMSYFILAKDLQAINMQDIENMKDRILYIATFIFLSIFGILYYVYSVNYKRFIQDQNELLAQSVEEKTKELQQYSDKLYYLAHHDLLTDTPNRLLFLDRLKQQIKHARRNGQSLGVLFMDLDRFKEINDTYGHEVGDKLLIKVAAVLKSCVRTEDTVARLGGDEFTILLINATQLSIIKIVEKIVKSMQEPFIINGIELYSTFSIGISIYGQDGDTPNILLRNADTAMYKAKENGRNSYQFYDEEMTELALRRIELDKSVRRALENGEFEPYFQPKVDARSGKVVGLEALIRWNHPTKGLISPHEFIPFAEEVGLILDIDAYMLKYSMYAILSLQEEGIDTGVLSVNISTKKLESQSFKNELHETIKSIGFDPAKLELEILESQIMKDPDHSQKMLNYIRELGILISIDDFGTGYSSLSYLSQLSIDKLKIDRSFIMHIPEASDDVAIVKTIISLARNLNLELIAEGVETKEQIDFLLKEGCHIIQGYYYSKPLSLSECREYLLSKRK